MFRSMWRSAIGLAPLLAMSFVPGTATATPYTPACGSRPAGAISANSCLDFSYSVQGANGWQYGYYDARTGLNPANFQQMGAYTSSQGAWWAADYTQYWTALDSVGGHPNGYWTSYHAPQTGLNPNPSTQQWAVRRFVIDPALNFNGTIQLSLLTYKDPGTVTSLGNGSTDYVLKYSGGVTTLLGTVALAYNQTTPQTLTYTTTAKSGDFIDFAIAPGRCATNPPTPPIQANGCAAGPSDYGDGTYQIATVQGSAAPAFVTPEPSSILLVGSGIFLAGLMKRRRLF